jgi:hypothetical protein
MTVITTRTHPPERRSCGGRRVADDLCDEKGDRELAHEWFAQGERSFLGVEVSRHA